MERSPSAEATLHPETRASGERLRQTIVTPQMISGLTLPERFAMALRGALGHQLRRVGDRRPSHSVEAVKRRKNDAHAVLCESRYIPRGLLDAHAASVRRVAVRSPLA